MNLDAWKNRLINQCPLLVGQVFLAVELASTEPHALTPPCAFVVPLSEKSSGTNNAGQTIALQIAVVSVVRNVADFRGNDVFHELDSVRHEVKNALIAWQPEIGTSNARYLGGELNYFDDMIASWVDRFEVDYRHGTKK